MTTHKAYRLHSYGGPECMHLDDVPIPQPGPTQVLVAVSTVGINPVDWKIREGHTKDFQHLELPATMGVDFVGTVVSCGDEVSTFKAGDRVTSFSEELGAFAEHIAVDQAILANVPATLDDITAATLPIPALSAWEALHKAGDIRPGMKVLIHGASGTVGAFAIQFAKSEGAIVIRTASAKNRGYVMSLGADRFIDYANEDFENVVSDIDVVLDFALMGGDRSTCDRSWEVLKKGGAIVSLADPTILGKAPEGYSGYFFATTVDAVRLEEIARRVAGGEVKSKVAQVFKRSELVEAMEINKRGGVTGRLVVDFQDVD